MLIDRQRPSKEKMRDLCIAAARAGQLPCVELLVTTHDANPYHAKRGVKMNEKLAQPSRSRLKKEQYQHSAFCYTILNGHSKMLRHLTSEQVTNNLPHCFGKDQGKTSYYSLQLMAMKKSSQSWMLSQFNANSSTTPYCESASTTQSDRAATPKQRKWQTKPAP